MAQKGDTLCQAAREIARTSSHHPRMWSRASVDNLRRCLGLRASRQHEVYMLGGGEPDL